MPSLSYHKFDHRIGDLRGIAANMLTWRFAVRFLPVTVWLEIPVQSVESIHHARSFEPVHTGHDVACFGDGESTVIRKLLFTAVLGLAIPAHGFAKGPQDSATDARPVATKQSSAKSKGSVRQPVVRKAEPVAHTAAVVISDSLIAEPSGDYVTIDDSAPLVDSSSLGSSWISDSAFSGSGCGDATCETGSCSTGSCSTGNCSTGSCGDCNGSGCSSCGGKGGGEIGSDEDCYRYGSFWEVVHSGRRYWVETQALGWFAKGQYLPALATTSPVGTPQGQAGVLGAPNTNIVFGQERVDDDIRTGGRINFGMWLIDGQFLGVVGDYYALEEQQSQFGLGSVGDPILARPFYNTELGIQDAAELAFPGFVDVFGQMLNLSGSVTVETHSRVQSAGVSLRKPTYVSFLGNYRMNLLGGYRFFRLNEGVRISDSVAPQGGFFVPGTTFDSFDNFDTENEFHGGEIGVMLEIRRCRWTFEFLTRVALGNMRQTVEIDGASSIFDTVNTVVTPGGLLTQPTNIGTYVNDEFSVIPEAGIKVGLQLTDSMKVSFGYNYIYISNVARLGGQIDSGVNVSQIDGGALVGQPRPAPRLNDTDFWLQGGTASLEMRF